MSRKYRLLLINPQNQYRTGFALTVTSRYPPISLGIIASLTPDHWDIQILDENFERFEEAEDNDPDLVGITSFSPNVYRAYQIAAHYRNKGIPVVLGGNHASMLPEETAQYVDVVFKGEAETEWKNLIKDFENNQLKSIYEGGRPSLDKMPPARHDLFHKDYLFSSMQTTRGCPFKCEFCSVHAFNGPKHRLRPVEDILDELEQIPNDFVFIVDDNFFGYSKASKEHSYQLLEGMVERGIKKQWFTQTSINIADDSKFLKLAAKAGCREVFIGVESDDLEQLKSANKVLNARITPAGFKKKFRKIQKAGISVLGAFIFGMDGDTIESIHRRARFIKKSGVDSIQTTLLMPPPGTKLYDRMIEENRRLYTNFPQDWEKYHSAEVVLQPDQMTAEELQHHMYIIWHKLYNKTAMRKRFLKTLWHTKNFKAALWAYVGNWHYRRIVFEMGGYDPDKHPDKQKRVFREPGTHKPIEMDKEKVS